MLVVHPASCCDICLETYSISSGIAHSPHTIACGHIFCHRCIYSLFPRTCPLCREPFQIDRVKKLYLENPPKNPPTQDNSEQYNINDCYDSLLQCVPLVSGEDAPNADAIKVATEVLEWLQSQSDDPNYHVPLQIAVASLQRCKVLQDQNEREKAECRRFQTTENDHDLEELSQLYSHLDIFVNPQPQYPNTSNPLPVPQPNESVTSRSRFG